MEAHVDRATFFKRREAWLAKLASDDKLNGSAYAVALAILSHVNAVSGAAWPRVGKLAKLTNRSTRTVQLAVRLLEARGHLGVRRQRGRTNTNTYVLSLEGALTSEEAEALKAERKAQARVNKTCNVPHEKHERSFTQNTEKETQVKTEHSHVSCALHPLTERVWQAAPFDAIHKSSLRKVSAALVGLGDVDEDKILGGVKLWSAQEGWHTPLDIFISNRMFEKCSPPRARSAYL